MHISIQIAQKSSQKLTKSLKLNIRQNEQKAVKSIRDELGGTKNPKKPTEGSFTGPRNAQST